MDLATTYLGLELKSPIVASSSPLTGDINSLRQMEDAGAGAVVLPSLFQEHIERESHAFEHLMSVGAHSSPEAGSYFPPLAEARFGPQEYLGLVSRARKALDIPVIASLNGTTEAGWVDDAAFIEEAGASALELNIYRVAPSLELTGVEVSADCIGLVQAVRRRVKLPLAVKLHPYYTAFGEFAHKLEWAGVDGLVLFNRVYQPDIDLVRLAWNNEPALSEASEMRIGLLWISILAGNMKRASLAASTGVDTSDEIVKYLLAGADVVMTAAALLRRGPRHMRHLVDGLTVWLRNRGFGSVADIRGLMRKTHPEVEALERSDYIGSLLGYRGPYVRR